MHSTFGTASRAPAKLAVCLPNINLVAVASAEDRSTNKEVVRLKQNVGEDTVDRSTHVPSRIRIQIDDVAGLDQDSRLGIASRFD